ncbi:A/G-specific adenine glycosylase [Granulicella sp. WH15]|uniref:A/G-specific adenine glycosylase n=1 Tax=Granulicella sp. WH15 TaxID=2602070 RepID=UPI001366FE38|nr:A/G-specific adenine glycosylase [Granulicella sp. WH15]QHN02044.1 A/G-specific adenine glycosylase [Granulicella sp. WH15]
MKAADREGLSPSQIRNFRKHLADWYRLHARILPWRGAHDPYRVWVSEIMLQQTRVAAVIDHYERFMRLFPTLVSLALAPEADVLAAWSGLGYYRRARMLHKAAQFVTQELSAKLPTDSVGLRTLPGIGVYTSAAVASICFGERIAVVDGNVERVLLRITGRPEVASAAAKNFIHHLASDLVPAKRLNEKGNAAGDHNQAMMELGATICLPRGPLCLHCPVYGLCRTRGEHLTPPRPRQRSRPAAYLLATRKRRVVTEVLLERRADDASLMPGMLELPPLPLDAVEGREPILRLRHSITNTNYYVGIYAQTGSTSGALRRAVPAAKADLVWHPITRIQELPVTGLTRKVLARLRLDSVIGPETPEQRRA